MDPEEPQSSRARKLKFLPRTAARKKPTPPKADRKDGGNQAGEDAVDPLTLRRFKDSPTRGTSEHKKSTMQFAFGRRESSSSPTRSWGKSSVEQKDSLDDAEIILPSTATVKANEDNIGDAFNQKPKDKYTEPQDYQNAYYPITLPYDPAPLDEVKFGEAEFGAAEFEEKYDENRINPASELELLQDGNEEPKLLLFQFPSSLPLVKRSATVKGKEKYSSPPKKGCRLEELPGGHIGKLLVYKSGAVKLKLGETPFNVFSGSHCASSRHIAAINTADKECRIVGEPGVYAAVVDPDIDSILKPLESSL